MRRLLLISYHFPPSNEVAGKPTARLVRYLHDFGWEPTVLTLPPDDPRVIQDETGYSDVLAASHVVRVQRGFSPLDVASAGARWRQRLGTPSSTTTSSVSGTRPRSFVSRLKASILECTSFPDAQAGWVWPAYRRACRLIKQDRFDAVMTVSPPASAHLIGLLLRRRSRLPWIAQFHDPWAENPFHIPSFRLLDRATRYLEAKVVRNADVVLAATDQATSRFCERYPDQDEAKFDTLGNGFDPLDFPKFDETPVAENGPLQLVHTGSLYGGRDPFPFLESLACLVNRGAVRPGDVIVRFIGDCATAMGKSVAGVVNQLGLDAFVKIEPPVSYPAALAALAQANVLLLFAQNQPAQIPAKLYEYLYLKRPILAFTSGSSADLIERLNAGIVVNNDSVAESSAALEKLINLHRDNQLTRYQASPSQLAMFEAKPLASLLAGKLDRLLGTQNPAESLSVPCANV